MTVLPVSFVATKLRRRLIMHAHLIIQDLLCKHCPQVHAKRRQCLAKVVEACIHSGLTLLRLSQALASRCSLKHRIKCCDRLLSNRHLYKEKEAIYGAMARSIVSVQPAHL